ncbi:NUDIX hydrolase domain-like protein [Gaertneriomyces semiglobifer]|nr:NUDIX hydrolase domain-like protein [Gaertneriomyces semiglobifer]
MIFSNWVQQGDVEILYIRRAVNERDKWSGHMAFPGGKAESNETDQQAVEREVLEELNLDLRSDGFVCIGEIGDREVTPMGGRRPVMILSCFVYLQLLPYTPPLTPQPSEIASVHWIPIHFFLSLARDPAQWVGIRFSMARILIWGRHAQHMALGLTAHLKRGVEKVLGWWLGSYTPFGVLLPHENSDTHHRVALTKTGKKTAKEATGQSSEGHLLLWGLTLSMTSEIVDLYYPLDPPLKDLGRPRFSQWDIRVWVRVWEGVGRVQAKLESGGRRSRGRRVNGEGFTTNTVVKCAIGSTVLGRGITMWIVWRGLLGVREWWRVWV